jgi:hypothetical protein
MRNALNEQTKTENKMISGFILIVLCAISMELFITISIGFVWDTVVEISDAFKKIKWNK